jgi:hypothetical protein
MRFNPITKEVFTDNGQYIKTLHCPYDMQWANLRPIPHDETLRQCSLCNHNVIDTAFVKDDELLKVVQDNPNTCLKINPHQNNIEIVTNGTFEQL